MIKFVVELVNIQKQRLIVNKENNICSNENQVNCAPRNGPFKGQFYLIMVYIYRLDTQMVIELANESYQLTSTVR